MNCFHTDVVDIENTPKKRKFAKSNNNEFGENCQKISWDKRSGPLRFDLSFGRGWMRLGGRARECSGCHLQYSNCLTMDRLVEGRWRPEYPKLESEKKVVRETILAVGPDMIALQEIGESAHLLELQHDLASEGIVYSCSA